MVTDLKEKYGFNVEVIKKTDIGLLKRLTMPMFPAVQIDEQVVFQGRDITIEELEREINQRVSD